MKLIQDNKSQVTIFIIIGVLIVIMIVLFFLFIRQDAPVTITKNENVDIKNFIDLCIEDKLTETLNILSNQGGYLNNSLNILYNDNKISYLCYNINNYRSCINQEPLLLRHLQNEIHDNIEEEMKNCFNELKENLEEDDYYVEIKNGDLSYDVDLIPDRIVINIKNEINLEKNGENKKIDNLIIVRDSEFYELAVVVQEIVSQEAKYCNFDITGFQIIYPDYDIDKKRLGDSSIIYLVRHKNSNEFFNFAVRSCGIPPGI